MSVYSQLDAVYGENTSKPTRIGMPHTGSCVIGVKPSDAPDGQSSSEPVFENPVPFELLLCPIDAVVAGMHAR